MRVLVTGAAGMIGRKLTARLAADGTLAGRRIDALHLHDLVAAPSPAGASFEVSAHVGDVGTREAAEGMAGLKADRAAEAAGRELPGKDLSPLLSNPGSQAIDAARPATLFTYSGLASNDSAVFDFAAKAVMAGKDPKEEAKKQGFRPDLKKRGHVRSAFDGRYRFTRYFSPLDHNSLMTIVPALCRRDFAKRFGIGSDARGSVRVETSK